MREGYLFTHHTVRGTREILKSRIVGVGRRGFHLGRTYCLVSAPSHPAGSNGVRQAGNYAFFQNKGIARLSHPYQMC